MLISEVNVATTKETLYRAFWRAETHTRSFYEQLTNEEILFRVRIRGKFLLGLVKAETIAEASFIVSGMISWSIKDILA